MRPRTVSSVCAVAAGAGALSSVLVVAEKPSVARDIAQVLGARTRSDGAFRGGGWIVTWAIGHLVALAEPHEMNPAWKRWRLADLPLLPASWPLVVGAQTRDQYDVVRRLLTDPDVRGVVCATDAGREGELIFRYIFEASRSKKPVKRLWISSLTPEAIAAGFRSLTDGEAFDRLADAARARSRADWLVGMNLSRVYSILHDDNLSVGRVQTPTLAMLVARELEIRAFVPEDYLEVVATFAPPEGDPADGARARYEGVWVGEREPGGDTSRGDTRGPAARSREAKRLPPDGDEASRVVARAKRGRAEVESVERQTRRLPPPQLYDLTELQRHANRLFGFTAQRTLELAQRLYEERKLLSYPRTDSRWLSRTVASGLGGVVGAIEAPYRALLADGTGARPLGPRFVDDARVSDHHAIIPTDRKAPDDLPADERKIYDLVCRRLLSAWHGDHVYAVTTVSTAIVTDETADRYVSSGTSVEVEGWKVLDVKPGRPSKDGKGAEPTLPGGLTRGMARRVCDAKAVAKQTRPPPRFTDATLLTAMETAGKNLDAKSEDAGVHGLDEKEISRAMRERGLGTPATRAAMIETLLRREYVVRDGKVFTATDKGIALIGVVHPHVKSPAMTGEWEAKLARIERGDETLDGFMDAIERYVREVVGVASAGRDEAPSAAPRESVARPASSSRGDGALFADAARPASRSRGDGALFADAARSASRSWGDGALFADAARPASSSRGDGALYADAAPAARSSAPRPARSRDLGALLSSAFGFASFRPYQEEVCRTAASGSDVLLVMPTGAGKSLCYQLPGLARGGTTLVVSPLIALMEDQVAQLVRRGFAAERIHSGRPRASSRAACKAYLDGALDFLFIAPERLKVPGFPEMLARRKPTLIAIDEAHCISQWGHDFRPDYRMLGERLPLLRPAPVIALTATATPAVQDDIAAELRLASPARFIHGFRRTNIGVEVVERSPGDRAAVVKSLLADPARRPAIVYAPTRSESENLGEALSGTLRAAAYHAGLPASVRERVQTAFLAGELDVIIATTAFGMGIDKPDVRSVIHTALPASIEGYYQEIGRAGRDGRPSRAVLLQSFVDTKTHEFFLERDYPDPALLARVQKAIGPTGTSAAALAKKTRVKAELFEKVLEKLWVHGGALVDSDDNVRPGNADWKSAYDRQRAHKREQLDRMRRYAETSSCRMLQLVAHFGDQNDPGSPCGMCDVCAPASCVALSFRAPSAVETDAARRVLEALRARDGRAVGQLHRDLFGDGVVDRKTLEHILGALARAGAVRIVGDEFEKDGATIAFQRVWLGKGEGAADQGLRMLVTPPPSKKGRRAKTRGAKRGARAKAPSAKRTSSSARAPASTGSPLESALRAWRSTEAKKRRVPAFRVLTDRTLLGIAETRPESEAQLLAVSGMGMALLAKYGKVLLALVARS
ncbi:MAG: DNA topoisomerase 3 [Labilithrix sp.]|nr:DNA topoisomerase 3 [Labilithrix sp.]